MRSPSPFGNGNEHHHHMLLELRNGKHDNEEDAIHSAMVEDTGGHHGKESSGTGGAQVIIRGPTKALLNRRKEVVFAKISLYIVFVMLVCHSLKAIVNTHEMISSYHARVWI